MTLWKILGWALLAVGAQTAISMIPYTKQPPRAYRDKELELTVGYYFLYQCGQQTCVNTGGQCKTNCGTPIPKGSRLRVLKIHHRYESDDALIRFTSGPDTTHELWVTWYSLKADIKPVSAP